MARAILKRTKVLMMDEVSWLDRGRVNFELTNERRRLQGAINSALRTISWGANEMYSVDYATDELIGKTIRQ